MGNLVLRRGKPIIRDIQLDLKRGTTTLIIGTSGAGKSTLINCIIDGTGVRFDEANPKIAYIQQHPALNKNLTVREAIYFSRRFEYLFESAKEINYQVDSYIEKLGLEGRENNKIRHLSGGQQQRVAIAKELIRDANILIADEIDTGLDCGVAYSLAEMLRDVTHEKGIVTLVISHNVVNIPLYDDVVVLAKDKNSIGGVAYYGSSRDIPGYFFGPQGKCRYWEILKQVNTKEEGGFGRGDSYIQQMKHYQSRKYRRDNRAQQ